MNLKNLSIDGLAALYRKREVTVTEIVNGLYQEIEEIDGALHVYLTNCRESALADAQKVDKILQTEDDVSPLAGIPVAIKDNMAISGIRMTCGSRILENYKPPYTATAVERLKKMGAIIIGKTNLDEFAMGSSTENSGFFPTRNPKDQDRVPGGSSGGSAASVAAGLSVVALGSDTGGSIRQPASFCGVVGMKPTYGRVSRYGLVAFASSLDQIGPFSKTVRETARLLEIISGFDPYDSTSVNVPTDDWLSSIDGGVSGARIGIPKEYFVKGLDPDVKDKVERGIQLLEDIGCRIEEVSLPHTEFAIATYYLIATAEASSNLARYDGVRFGLRVSEGNSLQEMYRQTRMTGFGEEVKRRILLGTYALSAGYYDAYYLKAQKVRTLILRDFQEAFKKVDLIVTPTAPTTAFKIGEKTGNPLSMYLSDIFTITCNLAGLPGISVPCGKDSFGMPVGMQLIGNHFREDQILQTAHKFERSRWF